MTKSSLRSALPLLLIAIAGAACSAQASEESSSPEGGDPVSDAPEMNAAKSSCSAEAYNQALVKYKAAVEGAKRRARGEVCDEGTPLYEISDNLRAATATCGKFESIIATSPWAQPVRDALKGNLTLAQVTGKLGSDLKSLGDALPGTTIYGPAPGVYGNMSKVTFEAGGKAKISRLNVSDEGNATWTDAPAKWSASAGKLSLEAEGKTIEFDVKLQEGDLHFVPKTGDEDFWSMPSECEA
jgi:hypothetical protein